MRYRRSLKHPGKRKLVEYLAGQQGVTVEHLLDIVAKRKAFRRARMFRDRSRRRYVKRNPAARRFRMMPGRAVYAGEGALHNLLREAGITVKDFCKATGTGLRTFYGWRGHPLHPLPIEFLRALCWTRNMTLFIASKGIEPAQFGVGE